MKSYLADNRPQNIVDNKQIDSVVSKARIFFYFALALAISGVVALFYPSLLSYLLESHSEVYIRLVSISMTVPSLFILFSGIAMSISFSKSTIEKKPIFMGILFFLYSIFIGMLLGTIFFYLLETEGKEVTFLLSMSFFITAGLFLGCGLASSLVKNTNGYASFLSSFVLGLIVLIILNVFLKSSLISWLSSIILFVYILAITMYDFHIINKLADQTIYQNKDAFALYFAYRIYTDFVLILIRVIYIVLSLYRRN